MGILEHQARRRYFLEPGFWRPCESTSLEVQPSGSLRGQRIDIFDEQYLVALLIVNEIVHLLLC
jgi:hypothetical protein